MSTYAESADVAYREKSAWWRAVLGEYPTGVSLVTTRDSEGEPAGMIVGSFVAVSEDPALIGFFAGTHSSTLPQIVASGHFTVSVLTDSHEGFCRIFTQKAADRWTAAQFEESATGSPRLVDAVVWFEASIESVHPYGDHSFVVGRVTELGTGPGGKLPLLFRRAGYGTFAAPSATYDARAFMERLRWVSMVERDIQALADELDVEITVNTQLGDSVVTLASVDPRASTGSYENVGASHPWAAPIASVFAAWAPDATRHAWEEASRHLTGSVNRPLIERLLSAVRARGYAIAGDRQMTERFLHLARQRSADRDSLAELWEEIAAGRLDLESDGEVTWGNVAVIQMPVFGREGEVLLSLYAIRLPELPDERSFDLVAEKLRAAADGIGQRIRLAQNANNERGLVGVESNRAHESIHTLAADFPQWGWGSL